MATRRQQPVRRSVLTGGRKRVLAVLFVPSVERDGTTPIDQGRWVDAALEMFGRVFGGATAYPQAKGVWRDDERNGALVKDEPVVVQCYTTPADIEDSKNLAELGSFCRTMGRDTRQGEVGLVIGDEYSAIRDFREEYQMAARLDVNRIARGLRAERKGRVSAGGGYFGAMQLLADIEARFRVPVGGGRATDPDWTERRLVPLAPRTLRRLEAITDGVRARSGVSVEPMQLAALLLEKTTEQINEEGAKDLVGVRRRPMR